jgi:hypothetical protein
VTRVRSLYAAAAVLLLVGLWLRLARSPLPRTDAASLPLPFAGQRASATAGATPPTSFEAIVTANILSQTRAAPPVRFSPAGRAGARPAAPAPRGPRLTLYGITVGPQGAVALIDADPKIPGAEIYRPGDLVAGAPLVAITDSTVTLAEPSGPLVLRLHPAQRRKP